MENLSPREIVKWCLENKADMPYEAVKRIEELLERVIPACDGAADEDKLCRCQKVSTKRCHCCQQPVCDSCRLSDNFCAKDHCEYCCELHYCRCGAVDKICKEAEAVKNIYGGYQCQKCLIGFYHFH